MIELQPKIYSVVYTFHSYRFSLFFILQVNSFHLPQHCIPPHSFMEVVKAFAKQGSAACDSVAIRADQKSYSYQQLISSAVNISRLLSSEDLKSVSKSHEIIM